jgi:hypothetical protein
MSWHFGCLPNLNQTETRFSNSSSVEIFRFLVLRSPAASSAFIDPASTNLNQAA